MCAIYPRKNRLAMKLSFLFSKGKWMNPRFLLFVKIKVDVIFLYFILLFVYFLKIFINITVYIFFPFNIWDIRGGNRARRSWGLLYCPYLRPQNHHHHHRNPHPHPQGWRLPVKGTFPVPVHSPYIITMYLKI